MKLALRTSAPHDASLLQRIGCAVIRARLASRYCHGGIVIGDTLYHATAADGLHATASADWHPERWDLIDVGDARDADALSLFARNAGAGYDWFSLLAFAGIPARDGSRMYCFEWAWLAMTGNRPTRRITPEDLLLLAMPAAVVATT